MNKPRDAHTVLQPVGWPRPRGYSDGIKARGETIFVGGMIGRNPEGEFRVGLVAQARQALANIAAVLRDCGAALTDVAKTTVFVTDIGQFAVVNAVYAEAFGDHRPARSTVQVAALPAGAEVEIEVWAYVSH